MPTRLAYAHDCLTGLSVADALGAAHFVPGTHPRSLTPTTTPPGPWPWTDDTEMAATIYTHLADDTIEDQDALATHFAHRADPYRGYGPGAVTALHAIRDGHPWREVAPSLFNGQGSFGNGAAMRTPPLGAYHHHDPERAAHHAALTARVTHAHPDAIAGAVAVALGACIAASSRGSGPPTPTTFLRDIATCLDPGPVRTGIERAHALARAPLTDAVTTLGNGQDATATDSVPLALWAAAHHLDDYPGAVITCIHAGGDMDTTAAMAGGIVAARTGARAIPAHWIAAREPLPPWVHPDTRTSQAGE